MKWNGLKDGPNENEMAQDGPNKGEIINLEYAREKSLEKSSVWTGTIPCL